MGQRDFGYSLDAGVVSGALPPFRYVELNRRFKPHWSIRDGRNHQVGQANTRAGARAAVRALYAGAAYGEAFRSAEAA